MNNNEKLFDGVMVSPYKSTYTCHCPFCKKEMNSKPIKVRNISNSTIQKLIDFSIDLLIISYPEKINLNDVFCLSMRCNCDAKSLFNILCVILETQPSRTVATAIGLVPDELLD